MLLTKILLWFLEKCDVLIAFLYQFFNQFIQSKFPQAVGMSKQIPEDVTPFFFSVSPDPKMTIGSGQLLPRNLTEAIFGRLSNMYYMPRFSYQSFEDGYYSFYINTYSNVYFLPDWMSQFLQINCNISLDIGILQEIQEIVFLFLVFFFQIVNLRLCLYWFLIINPFSRPWIYLTSLVDWSYDLTAGLTPGVWGLDVGFICFMSFLGKITDFVNFIVFTMPYLPSEGIRGVVDEKFVGEYTNTPDVNYLLEQKPKDVIFFKYLPRLWYEYGVPNEIREYWFNYRPDILKYMTDYYHYLGMNFYPDGYTEQLIQNSNVPTTVILDNTIYLNKIPYIITLFLL